MNRKKFIRNGVLGFTGIWTIPTLQSSQDKEQLSQELVKEFVVAGHRSVAGVKELLVDTPSLIYSKYDWGNGDYEEAIGGAGHVGNKDVANFLIEKGARVNLFVLTMLGRTELVKPVLEAYPSMVFSKGPHGFTLLHHAQVGGKDAKDLHDYLLTKGLTETQLKF